MLSGVGPANHLQKIGISVLHNLPGVGSHLVDHPVVDMYFKDKYNVSTKHVKPKSLYEVFQIIGSAIQYLTTQRGPLVTNVSRSVNGILFFFNILTRLASLLHSADQMTPFFSLLRISRINCKIVLRVQVLPTWKFLLRHLHTKRTVTLCSRCTRFPSMLVFYGKSILFYVPIVVLTRITGL